MDTHFLRCKSIDRIEAVSAAAPVLPAIAEIFQPTLKDNRFIPIMTAMKAAPDALLKKVHCNCTKNGLPYTSACGLCQVTCCDNLLNQASEELENSDAD